jgi:hypothetical protein
VSRGFHPDGTPFASGKAAASCRIELSTWSSGAAKKMIKQLCHVPDRSGRRLIALWFLSRMLT